MCIETANAFLNAFASTLGTLPEAFEGVRGKKLKTGVDLGTANICIAVLDENDRPVTGEIFPASVVKDGLVLDYAGAVRIVRELKGRIESRLGVPIRKAAAAIPPGTVGKNASVVANVVQAADIEVTGLIDEPEAAALALGIRDGAVVDVGGGTTGISILKDGRVVAAHDEATGGSHMTLVLAGNYGIAIDEAEALKLDTVNHGRIFSVIRPVAEKMASIARNFVRDYDVERLYIVGGASSFDGFEAVFEGACALPAVKPEHCLLATPLGIAMHCRAEETGR